MFWLVYRTSSDNVVRAVQMLKEGYSEPKLLAGLKEGADRIFVVDSRVDAGRLLKDVTHKFVASRDYGILGTIYDNDGESLAFAAAFKGREFLAITSNNSIETCQHQNIEIDGLFHGLSGLIPRLDDLIHQIIEQTGAGMPGGPSMSFVHGKMSPTGVTVSDIQSIGPMMPHMASHRKKPTLH